MSDLIDYFVVDFFRPFYEDGEFFVRILNGFFAYFFHYSKVIFHFMSQSCEHQKLWWEEEFFLAFLLED